LRQVKKFQFLQGTVQTKEGGVKDGENGEVFQFLQGTVQTVNHRLMLSLLLSISIPPRYGTNRIFAIP